VARLVGTRGLFERKPALERERVLSSDPMFFCQPIVIRAPQPSALSHPVCLCVLRGFGLGMRKGLFKQNQLTRWTLSATAGEGVEVVNGAFERNAVKWLRARVTRL
jgi:hypothetical protein